MKYIGKIVVLLFLFNFAFNTNLNRFNNLNEISPKINSDDSLKSMLKINFLGQTLKNIYNNLLKQVIKEDGKIGKFTMEFGQDDDHRYMVATDDIKVKNYPK